MSVGKENYASKGLGGPGGTYQCAPAHLADLNI
jgi:hypothetical protein